MCCHLCSMQEAQILMEVEVVTSSQDMVNNLLTGKLMATNTHSSPISSQAIHRLGIWADNIQCRRSRAMDSNTSLARRLQEVTLQ